MRGPQHDPMFEVEVLIGDEVLGVGEGRSKRVAERAAATAALGTRHEVTDAISAEEERRPELPASPETPESARG